MWDHGVASYLPKQNRWQQRYGDDRHTFTTLAVSPEGRAFLGVRQLGLITIEPNGKQSLQTSSYDGWRACGRRYSEHCL